MMMNLMTILVKKVFISSKPTFVYLLCPPLCGPFSIQESAAGGLSYKVKNRPPISRQTLPTFTYNFFLKYTLFPEFIFQFHIFPAIFHLFPAAVFALHFKPAARSLAVFLRGFFFDMCQLANLPLYNLLFRSVHTYSLSNLFYYNAYL